MKQERVAHHLDLRALARSSATLTGHDMLSKYERLIKETRGLGADKRLNWSARGELRADQAAQAQVWLHLTVETRLPLTCQRCLGQVDVAVAVKRSFHFVDDEATAQVLDEAAEEDVLVLSSDFCLSDLIEDEVLLALPFAPRHERCPIEVKLTVQDPGFEAALAQKPSPFSALQKLRDGKSGEGDLMP